MVQEAFKREVAILKACRNRNIVGFLGEYVDTERTWLIMEYMEVGHPQAMYLLATCRRVSGMKTWPCTLVHSSGALPDGAVNTVAANSLAICSSRAARSCCRHSGRGRICACGTLLFWRRPVTCTRR